MIHTTPIKFYDTDHHSVGSIEKELTPMQKLIQWIDSEIIINPYYRASPRLCEGAMIVKCKATELLPEERNMVIDARISVTGLNHASPTDDNSLQEAEDYFNSKYKQ